MKKSIYILLLLNSFLFSNNIENNNFIKNEINNELKYQILFNTTKELLDKSLQKELEYKKEIEKLKNNLNNTVSTNTSKNNFIELEKKMALYKLNKQQIEENNSKLSNSKNNIEEQNNEIKLKIEFNEKLLKETQLEIEKYKKDLANLELELNKIKKEISHIYQTFESYFKTRKYLDAFKLFEVLKPNLSFQQIEEYGSFFMIYQNINNDLVFDLYNLSYKIKNKKLIIILINEFLLQIKEGKITNYQSLLNMKNLIIKNNLISNFERDMYLVEINLIEGKVTEAIKLIIDNKSSKNLENEKYLYLLKLTLNSIEQQEKLTMSRLFNKTYKEFAEDTMKNN